MAIINERIKQKRLSLSLTLLQVAEALGVTEATAQRYESGEIKTIGYEKVIALANLFKCSPSYLMGWEDDFYGKEIIEDRSRIIKRMISEQGYTISGFAKKCSLPEKTLKLLFKKGIDDTNAADIETICENLGIDWDDLDRMSYGISPKEKMDEEVTSIAISINQNKKLKLLYELCKNLKTNDIDLLIDMAERMR